MTILHLLNALIDIEVDMGWHHPCNGLLEVPLPCSRGMWEATTCSSWETEYRIYLATRNRRKILLYADLVDALHLERNGMSKSLIGELDNWCANLDGLGTLVLMAALTI